MYFAANDTDAGFVMLGDILQDINVQFSQRYGVPQEMPPRAPLHGAHSHAAAMWATPICCTGLCFHRRFPRRGTFAFCMPKTRLSSGPVSG